jgi:hypothetical protein
VGARRAAGGGATYLRRTADVERGGADEDDVSHLGAAEVVDGEADAGGSPTPCARPCWPGPPPPAPTRRRGAPGTAAVPCGAGRASESIKRRAHALDRSINGRTYRTWQHLGVTGSRPVTCDGDTSSIWKPMECSTGSSSAVLFGGG